MSRQWTLDNVETRNEFLMKAMYFKFQFSAVLPSADRFCGSNTADKASSTATSVPVRHFSPGDDRNMLDHSNV